LSGFSFNGFSEGKIRGKTKFAVAASPATARRVEVAAGDDLAQTQGGERLYRTRCELPQQTVGIENTLESGSLNIELSKDRHCSRE
jgi:hypothetical protein